MNNCPQCGGLVEKCYLLERANAGSTTFLVDGELTPPNSMFPLGRFINIKKFSSTVAYKCTNCGLVQLYAGDIVLTKSEMLKKQYIVLAVALGAILIFALAGIIIGSLGG